MNAPVRFTDRPARLKLRVEDFELLEAGGAFADLSKAELIDGDIYVVNAQYSRHGVAKGKLFYRLMQWVEALAGSLHVYSEVSLRVAADSMPEPDNFVAPRQSYGPVPAAGVVLVIEVADTTLATDLGRKAELYAAAGIPEYWVADVNGGRMVRHVEPGETGYGTIDERPFGAPFAAATIAGLAIDTGRLID